METLENQLLLMEKYGLTAEELLVIDLLFRASIEEGHSELLVKYFTMSIERSELRDLLESLQNKGIIVKSYKIPAKGTKFDPEAVEFNKNFLNNYRKFSGELGIEFFNEFPSIAIIGGTEAPLKNYAKKFNSEEDFFYHYGKSIGWKQSKHQEILELIKWGKDNGCKLLNMNIADFVISKMWNSVAELKNGDGMMQFDTVTVL